MARSRRKSGQLSRMNERRALTASKRRGGRDTARGGMPWPPTCPACGGSGLRADELRQAGDELTPAEVEMLDSTRCRTCSGTG